MPSFVLLKQNTTHGSPFSMQCELAFTIRLWKLDDKIPDQVRDMK